MVPKTLAFLCVLLCLASSSAALSATFTVCESGCDFTSLRFDAFPNGVTDIGDGSYGTAINQSNPPRVLDGALELIRDVSWQQTSWTLPVMNVHGGFSASFSYRVDSANAPADGFSFHFGDANISRITGPPIGMFLEGLTIEWRTWSQRGYRVLLDGAELPGGYVYGNPADGALHTVTVSWNPSVGLSLDVDGAAIFSNLSTGGFAPRPADLLAFSGRTGELSNQVLIDDIVVAGIILTSAPDVDNLPARYALRPNVPNPFNCIGPPTFAGADTAELRCCAEELLR